MLTVTREGPFWEAVEGRAPLSPSAVTLGWELVAIGRLPGRHARRAFLAGELAHLCTYRRHCALTQQATRSHFLTGPGTLGRRPEGGLLGRLAGGVRDCGGLGRRGGWCCGRP